MTENELLQTLKTEPESITFQNVITVVDNGYIFTPSKFTNGKLNNAAGENSGSCKIFSFAQSHQLTKEQTLNCFGDYYRIDVLENPENNNHQNIRNFMDTGWSGITFVNNPLSRR